MEAHPSSGEGEAVPRHSIVSRHAVVLPTGLCVRSLVSFFAHHTCGCFAATAVPKHATSSPLASAIFTRSAKQLESNQRTHMRAHTCALHQSSFSCPVTSSTKLFGPGPTATTVLLPGATCVRPASRMT